MESPAGAHEEGKQLKVTKKTLQAVLEQCQLALELLQDDQLGPDALAETTGGRDGEGPTSSSLGGDSDCEIDELCDLLKSKVESPDFLDKLGASYISVSPRMCDESATWDIVNTSEVWEEKHIISDKDPEDDGFVFVKQEDIVDGIACFMAAYLSSLKQTKELTPNQLQEALCKTFSLKKRKGKLRRAWDGSIVVYNVASWGATAIGMYQNPAVFKAASAAFWSSCHVISKLL